MKGIIDYIFRNKKKNVKLKDCLICHSSTLTESEVLANEGMYPVYGASGIFAHFSQHHVNGDSILIIKDGSNVGKLQYASDKYSVIGTLNYLMAKNGVCLKYIYYCMQSLSFEKYRVGSGIPHIYFKDYGKELIHCPEFTEQERIAKVLSTIDYKIIIEKNILGKFYKQKSYLLQNLFI
ncbi:restriction endonuclease subunit S [Dysgonomonas sp. PH5-45]|uniref:restriction endonuclease subunit S n=1 Tax=Dysgonomonas sp. PH5-45 TaxID=1742396 RepID=UPI0032AE932E